MFLSMGNILNNAEIGLLFMCFEKPHRIRVQCKAELLDDVKFKNFFQGLNWLLNVPYMSFGRIVLVIFIGIKELLNLDILLMLTVILLWRNGKGSTYWKMFFPKTTKTKLEMLEKLASTIGLKK